MGIEYLKRIKKERVKKVKPKIGRKTCRSDWEFQVWKGLQHQLPRGAELEYEPETLDYVIESTYLPDFRITLKDGTTIYVEAKGLHRNGGFDYDAQRKMVAVKKAHPEKDIRIVFMKEGPISPRAKMQVSQWAVKYGFPYAIGSIPTSWFEIE